MNHNHNVVGRQQNQLPSYTCTSAEETEMILSMPCNHSGFADLCQNYEHAVDCVVQCDSIIKALQEQLSAKDEHIASLEDKIYAKEEQITSLEDKIVLMSLELASSKASEDHLQHRLSMKQKKARVCDRNKHPPTHTDQIIVQEPDSQSRARMQHRVSWSIEDELSIAMDKEHDNLGRASPMDIFLESSTGTVSASRIYCDNTGPSSSTRSGIQSPLDESSSSRLSTFGQLFRMPNREIPNNDPLALDESAKSSWTLDDYNIVPSSSTRSGIQGPLDESSSSRLSTFGYLFRMSNRQIPNNDPLALDESTKSSWTLDDSSSSRLSNLGQLFRKNRSQRGGHVESSKITPSVENKNEEEERQANMNGDARPIWRPTNP